METWEKDLILKNRDRLVTNTICSTLFLNIFLSKEVFSREDVQNIEAEGKSGRFIQSASLFYDLISTRAHAFNLLLEALEKTNQSGALKILTKTSDDRQPSNSPALCDLLPINQLNDPNMSNKPQSLRKFQEVPDYMQRFLGSKKKTTLIISSEDCKITCIRINETLENCILFNLLGDFLEFLTTKAASCVSLPVLNCENILEETLRLTCKIKTKFVLIAEKIVDKECSNYVTTINNNLQRSHMTIVEDVISWNDFTPNFGLELCTQLENWPDLNLSRNEILEDLEEADTLTFVKLINKELPPLFKQTIPKPIKNYIARSLSPRNLLSTHLFKLDCEDVFFFEGITLQILRTMTIQSTVSDSSSIIQEGYQLFCRFVVLDHEDHFDRICKNIINKALHLLTFDGKNFIWIKTSGQIDTIQDLLLASQNSFSEKDFLGKLMNSNATRRQPICISDTPGMGKSVLLGNIAQIMQNEIQNGLVGFVMISEVVREISSLLSKIEYTTKQSIITDCIINALAKISFGRVFLRKNTHFLKELFLDGFDEIDQETEKTGLSVLISLPKIFPEVRLWVTTRPHMLLKLERALGVMGFNIQPFCEDDQVNFLTSFWQVNSEIPLAPNKIKAFAEHCLDQIKSTIDAREQDIAGIPLQCLLIAEVFEDEALEFCKSTHDHRSNKIAIHHMIQLYECLVEKKFNIFFSRYKTTTPSISSRGYLHQLLNKFLPSNIVRLLYDDNISKQELVNVHVFRSVELFFPELAVKLRRSLCPKNISEVQIVNCGLMELKTSSVPSFVHRTIAEYFVAKLFIDTFNGRHNKSTRELIFVQIFWAQEAKFSLPNGFVVNFFEFKNNVICYFIDALLGKNHLPLEFVKYLPENGEKVYSQHTFVQACAAGNFQNLFSCTVLPNTFKLFRNLLFMEDILCIVVARGYLKMLNMCKDIFLKMSLGTVNQHRLRLNSFTLLHCAVAGGHFQMVKHLCENENFRHEITNNANTFKNLVYVSVFDTKGLNDRMLDDRLQILNFIWEIDNNLFLSDFCDREISFWLDDIHKKLSSKIFYLISNDTGASEYLLHKLVLVLDGKLYARLLRAFVGGKTNQEVISMLSCKVEELTLLQQIVQKMEPADDLCDFLSSFDINELCSKHSIFKVAVDTRKNKKWLLWLLENTKVKQNELITFFPYFLTILEKAEMIHVLDYLYPSIQLDDGNNLLHMLFTVYQPRKYRGRISALHLVRRLIENGVDVNAVNEELETPLHMLAKQCVFSDTYSISGLLVESGANINATNLKGNTPFHILLENRSSAPIIQLFLRMGADVNIRNCNNETPMSLAVSRYKWEPVIRVLVTNGNPDYKTIGTGGNKIIHLLLKHCINTADEFWYFVTHLQSIHSLYLLEVSNKNGETALQIASKKNLLHLGINNLLRSEGIIFNHKIA